MFGKKKPKDKKSKPKSIPKCSGTWQEKRWNENTGRWIYATRYCSLNQGHGGAHR